MKRLAIGFVSSAAFAHEGQPLAPHDLAAAWAWDPLILVGLLLIRFSVLAWRVRGTRHSAMGTPVLLGRAGGHW